MKGGFGKFLTFILGLVVGVLLVGGTIAGVVYYAVAAVSVNDVENYTKQEFTFIDKDAEIRNKSILDIYDMVKGGNIKETTVSDAKRIFGIDIIKILENSLEITVDDKSRETLGAMKVADVFKDNNLKVVLNCFTLGDVLKKTGIDTTTGLASKPIVQEHISEPVIDGFNALLKSLEINEMTIAEMQYLLGVSFGAGGVLDTVANVKIGDLNSAINNIKFEDVLPDFDRDFYAEWNNTGAVLYKKESGGEIKLKQLIEADGKSEFFKFVNTEAKDPAKTYYKLNREEGTIKVSDDGNWELIKELPDFNNRYDISGKRNRFGLAYVVLVDDNQIKITKRYADRDCTVENEDGMYYFKYTKDAAGTNYRYGAAIRTKIQDATGTEPAKYAEIIEWRGYVETTKTDYFETGSWKTYGYSRYGKVTDEELTEYKPTDSLARYALMHVGKSEPVLKALADETLNTLDGAIGDMKLGQVIEITDDSADILKKLKDSKISEIDKDVKNVKVGDIMKVVSVTTAVKAEEGEYIALPARSDGKKYEGTFITAKYRDKTIDEDKTVFLVKYKKGLAWVGDRYNITEKASNGVVVALADKTIGELQTAGIDDLINTARLSDVMDIDGDVFVLDSTADAKFILDLDENNENGFFRLATADDTAKDKYKRVYEGDGNAVIKKLSTIGVNNIAARMDDVVNSTLLKEVVEVKERYKLRVATAADIDNTSVRKYISLADVYAAPEYAGTFNVGYVETDPDTDVKFVRATGTIAASVTQYVIVDKASSGVLVGLQDKTIGTLSTGVDEVVNGATLSDVLEIDGKVYVKAADFDAAVTISNEKIGQEVAYYKDGNLFLEAGYVRNNNGDYVLLSSGYYKPTARFNKTGESYTSSSDGEWFQIGTEWHNMNDYKRYNFDGETATVYYACIYEGESDKILSKMATMTVKDLADSGTMDKIVKDMRIGDVMELNDTNSILYELGNSKISSIEAEVSDKIKVATLRDLNKWGNLGLKETDDELKKKVYYNGATIEVGNMKAVEFLIFAIKALPTL